MEMPRPEFSRPQFLRQSQPCFDLTPTFVLERIRRVQARTAAIEG
jgi:hypothetical protein